MIFTGRYIVLPMNSNTQTISHFFLLSLAYGTQVFSPVVSTKLTGAGFYKLGNAIVLASLVFAFGIDLSMDPALSPLEYGFYGALIGSHVLTSMLHKDQKSILMWIFYAFQFLSFSAFVFYVFKFEAAWINLFFISSLLLGIANYSMLLGHYYLVVPKLSEEPLIYCLNIFWVVIFLRMTSSLAVIFSSGLPYLEEGTSLGDGYMYNWLFISMRYLWGYIAPLILSFFTFRLCRLRSIQSATGVLYIVEFFVIVGELISAYLMAKHGLAL
jgi:hypothetical protein